MELALGAIMQVPLGWKMVEPRAWASMSSSLTLSGPGSISSAT
jgi:hypothetical protein